MILMETEEYAVEFTTLCSGSEGNCTYIRAGQTRLLVDIGCSAKRAEQGLRAIGEDPATIDAVLITHEHSDHIKGIDVFARRYHVPVYASPLTWEYLPFAAKLAKEQVRVFARELDFNGLGVTFFKTSHDACQPVGMVFWAEGRKLGLLTDSGCVGPAIMKALTDVDACILEANHNATMLKTGPYPLWLKKRVGGEYGHLSNVQAAQVLAQIGSGRLQRCVLAHLSKTNNLPNLALSESQEELSRLGINISFVLEVAPRYEAAPLYRIL